MAFLLVLHFTSFGMHALVLHVTVKYALQVLEQLDSCLEEAGIGRANLTEVGPPRCVFLYYLCDWTALCVLPRQWQLNC